jgi:hypothetical protein
MRITLYPSREQDQQTYFPEIPLCDACVTASLRLKASFSNFPHDLVMFRDTFIEVVYFRFNNGTKAGRAFGLRLPVSRFPTRHLNNYQ